MKVFRLNKNKIIKFIIFIAILFGIGSSINILIRNNNSYIATNESNESLKGLGLFISDKSNNIHNSIIDYNRIEDYSYTFMNRTGVGMNCCLSIFVDGKQISILDTNNNRADYNYKFLIENNEDINLPIKLMLEDLQDGSHIVNFNIVSDYDKYASDNNAEVWMTSTYEYVAAIEKNSDILNVSELSNISFAKENILEDKDISQFIANFDKESFNANQKPRNCITSKPNQVVEIPFVIGGSDTSNILIYATLDNKQIEVNDSDRVIYQLDKDNVAEVIIKINSPSEVGRYELIFYSINNLIDSNVKDYTELRTSASHRITLNVE